MAGNEPVTSPDQHKPGRKKAARVGAVLTIVALLCMSVGNNNVSTGRIFLYSAAGLIALALIVDWVLRRNGLRSGD